MTVLTRYLSRRFATHYALVLVGLTALALTFELMEEADNVLARSHGEASALLRFSALRLPDIVSQMLPFAALLGALLTFGLLLRHSELVAMWASGVSRVGLMRALLPAGLVLAVLQFALDDRAVPAALDALSAWGVSDVHKRGFMHSSGDAVWLLSGSDIVRLPGNGTRAGRLEDLRIFRRDDSGLLVDVLDAKTAEPTGDAWMLSDVTRRTVDPPQIETLPKLLWNGRLDANHIPLISRDLREMPIDQIRILIANEGYGQRPTSLYQTWFHYRIASAFRSLALIVLVVALAQRFQRAGAIGTLLMVGVASGFSYVVFDGGSLAMGEAGSLPPWIAAWSPNAVLGCVVGSLMLRGER